jgi:hypothetical protein
VNNPIARGDRMVRGVDRMDRGRHQIWFHAGGIAPGHDPDFVHHCGVNFDGSMFVVPTGGDGAHALEFAPHRRFLVDRYSRVDLAPVATLCRAADGARVCGFERGEADALWSGGRRPIERLGAPARDDVRDIFGVIFRPAGFEPAKNIQRSTASMPGRTGRLCRRRSARFRPRTSWPNSGFSSSRSTSLAQATGRRSFTTSAGKTSVTRACPTGCGGSGQHAAGGRRRPRRRRLALRQASVAEFFMRRLLGREPRWA